MAPKKYGITLLVVQHIMVQILQMFSISDGVGDDDAAIGYQVASLFDSSVRDNNKDTRV